LWYALWYWLAEFAIGEGGKCPIYCGTSEGIRLDRLTATQRRILQLLKVDLPWPEQQR